MTVIKTLIAHTILILAVSVSFGCTSKSSTEIACGGSMNFACPADMYCNMKEDCGGIDRNGVCTFRPTQCKSESNPICGCDGETYSNPCLAAAKGVSQKELGECKAPPVVEPEPEEEDEMLEEDGADVAPEVGPGGE
jgi:hypothetical protein